MRSSVKITLVHSGSSKSPHCLNPRSVAPTPSSVGSLSCTLLCVRVGGWVRADVDEGMDTWKSEDNLCVSAQVLPCLFQSGSLIGQVA